MARWSVAGVIAGLGVGLLLCVVLPSGIPAGVNRADFVSVVLTSAGLVATVAGLGFAIQGYFNVAVAERLVTAKIAKELAAFRQQLAQEQAHVQEATQKIVAGYQALSLGDVDQAISLFEDAVRVFPQAFNGYTSLGYAYRAKGDRERSIHYFRKAAEVFPHRKEPYNDLARIYAEDGVFDLALHYVERAISVDPSVRAEIRNDPVFDALRRDPELGPKLASLLRDGAA